ncbi:MAG: SdpI family protein, partial [Lachnospiraceae bacterium]|nr:SdpI family protein [Lachnospiraceae bacterium]
SSLMTLSPILIGLLLWNRLPEQIVTHWDMKGTPDGSMGKALAVFLPPLLCLILHLFCAFITTRDSENKRQYRKIVSQCLWITPVIVLLTSCWVFAFALGTEFNLTMMLFAVIGIAFILIGNYMPKCRQNYFIGIKITWTLHSEENWNRTHRFAGKIWVLGGFLFLLASALPGVAAAVVMSTAGVLMVLVPVIYSYLFYRKQLKEGKITEEDMKLNKTEKKVTILVLIFTAVTLLIAAAILFLGKFDVKVSDEALHIDASGWSDVSLPFAEIDRIEFIENGSSVSLQREIGYGAMNVTMGDCMELKRGRVSAYVYNDCDAYVVIYSGDKILMINQLTVEETKALYEELSAWTK